MAIDTKRHTDYNPVMPAHHCRITKITTRMIEAVALELWKTKNIGELAGQFKVSKETIKTLANRLRNEGFDIPKESKLPPTHRADRFIARYKKKNPGLWDKTIANSTSIIYVNDSCIHLNEDETAELKNFLKLKSKKFS